MKRQPIFKIGIGDLDVEICVFLPDIDRWFKPRLEAVGVDLLFYYSLNLKPRVLFFLMFHVGDLDFHRFIHRCGKPDFAEDSRKKLAYIITPFFEIQDNCEFF
jgi:hypothetical protein